MSVLPQSSPLFRKEGLAVSSRGEIVTMRIGNTDIPMHYEQAIDLSRWIRSEAAIIKRARGRQRTTRSLGIMHDAEAKAKPIPNHKPGVHVKERLAKWHRGDVTSEGNLICTRIGGYVFKLHFANAITVSHWLRIRGKEARNTAGDTRHWSAIGSIDA